jgi:small subunit ribosomal protein S5
MAGLESLRTPDEVADLRGLSVDKVLGLTTSEASVEGGAEPAASDAASEANGRGEAEAARVSAGGGSSSAETEGEAQ